MMTNQKDIQISRVHSDAVCEEIGERLSVVLGPQSIELPPNMLALIEQLAKGEPREKSSKFDGI